MEPLVQNKNTDPESGQILLLLLLIMSMALVVALGMIQLAVTQKTTVRYEDFSLRAYYAAEAGIEDSIPRLEQLSDLAGAAVDERMSNPAFGLTVLTPTVLAGDADYTYTRSVGRENVWVLERSIDTDATAQFDISDTDEVSLENATLEITWEDLDATCDDNGNCDNAVETILVWETPSTTNLMPNPSFEEYAALDGPAAIKPGQSWNKLNGLDDVTMDTTNYRYGETSQRINDTSVTRSVGITLAQTSGNMIPVQPDTTYTLSVYVYIESLSGGAITLQAQVFAADQSSVVPHSLLRERELTQTTGIYWERLYYTFTTGTGAAYLQPFVYITDAATGVVYVDGIQLEEQDLVTAYCDGTQPNSSWDAPGAEPFSSSSRTDSFAMERHFFDARTPPICDPEVVNVDPCYNSYFRSTDWDPVDDMITVEVPIDQASTNRAFRMKSMYSPIQVSIRARSATWPTVTYKLVGQEITIRSTGYYANTKKTLEVQHGLPSMMPQFDYVLYNYGCVDATCIPRDLIK